MAVFHHFSAVDIGQEIAVADVVRNISNIKPAVADATPRAASRSAKGRPVKEAIRASTGVEKDQLRQLSQSKTASTTLKTRAQIIIRLNGQKSITDIAKTLKVSVGTIRLWRQRWNQGGIEALYDRRRGGRPPLHDEGITISRFEGAYVGPAPTSGRATVRSVAEEAGVSKSHAFDMLKRSGLRSPRRRRQTLIDLPPSQIVEIAGLYLNPPDAIFALCFDRDLPNTAVVREKTAPHLDLDYASGTVTRYRGDPRRVRPDPEPIRLLAALDVATGRTRLTPIKRRLQHRHFLRFLNLLEKSGRTGMELRLVSVSYRHEQDPLVRARVLFSDQTRIHRCSDRSEWLRELEFWFDLQTRRQIRDRARTSVRAFRKKVEAAMAAHEGMRPFIWTAQLDSLADRQRALRRNSLA